MKRPATTTRLRPAELIHSRAVGYLFRFCILGLLMLSHPSARCEWRNHAASSGGTLMSVFEDSSGTLYFATTTTVIRYDGLTWSYINAAEIPGSRSGSFSSALVDRSGRLWMLTEMGVSVHDGNSWRTFTAGEGAPSDSTGIRWTRLFEDLEGNIWVGADTGYYGTSTLARFDGTTWETVRAPDGTNLGFVWGLSQERSGALWFVGTYGLARYDGQSWDSYTESRLLGASSVISLIEDRAGQIWIILDQLGISRFDGIAWRRFTTLDGLASNDVRSVLEDRDGRIWVGTAAGVSRFDGTA